ncbi:RNase adapter RapZ [Sphingomonas jeddahensis]|uniref:GlmZ(SRNA)-inactivating NTPase n=1 Tax=Sphingomonas jeddahensis TaxID=1915074 RepID=A0A1V2ES26_9SPHN|nr:RNase adapter RapZ [Sphingomonas jeddahensis]ONF95476.1 glmZ(sRNA)-inactivating NTPase [Sphingomonas jeddahensis]
MNNPPEILLVTGLSGAGKSTVLKTLEDLGWETVDNLPLSLLDRLLGADAPPSHTGLARPLAIGIGAMTRDFDSSAIARQVDRLRAAGRKGISTLFLDCATDELARRYDETRHRHPLAPDRPAREGIEQERLLLEPLRRWAPELIETSRYTGADLTQHIRRRYARQGLSEPAIFVTSFGFSRGLPPDADLVFDMRFLRNPHWDPQLRPGTGMDAPVAAYVAEDPAYEPAISRIEDLLLLLLPNYQAQGKSYINIAFGCTGGRHRSVHVAERVAARLRNAAFSPTVTHRDLAAVQQDGLEGRPDGR